MQRQKDMRNFNDDSFNTLDFESDIIKPKKYKEPKQWTLITALNRVLDQAKGSELDDKFWKTCKNPIDYLANELELTRVQVVFLAILIEAGEPLSWRKFGNYLGCSRLSMMVYSEDLEELVAKRWLMHKGSYEMNGCFAGFALVPGVVTAMRYNKKFIPEKIDGLTEQEFVDRLESYMNKNLNDSSIDFQDNEEWMVRLCEANPHLPLCQEVLALDDIHDRSLLLMIVLDFAQWAESDGEGLALGSINTTYPEDYNCGGLRRKLKDGSHILIQKGLIENKCEDGIADSERFMLTKKTKKELLSAYKPSRSMVITPQKEHRFLKSFAEIKEKGLFYNESEQEQIDRLVSLLSQDSLPSIQQRLEEQGMRKGFACLFYGGPGTGKTETVLQIARKTGRDIMQVDIAGLRDKWVGESEKNIKNVFSRYKELCNSSEVMPILFFNEADGIINKRTENISHSVDKMDNAMQNIILQEIEDLEGILIATTNLAGNLDHAFERRFLYKIEFTRPTAETKSKIWQSMIPSLSRVEAEKLSLAYDFSGGQIENISRKMTVESIISGSAPSYDRIFELCSQERIDTGARKAIGF